MFHAKLLELESELLAKEEASRVGSQLPPECESIMQEIENEVGAKLADKSVKDWRGWLTFRRAKNSVVICRGQSFSTGGITPQWRIGFAIVNGSDSVRERMRGFDVSPSPDLDHLLLNFGMGDRYTKVFLWYGEHIAPYRLIFEADVTQSPEESSRKQSSRLASGY